MKPAEIKQKCKEIYAQRNGHLESIFPQLRALYYRSLLDERELPNYPLLYYWRKYTAPLAIFETAEMWRADILELEKNIINEFN